MDKKEFISETFGAASTLAEKTDFAFWFIFGVSLVSLIGITCFMIFCCIRYSRKRNPVATNIHGNVILETLWTVIPTILVMFMFWFGWEGYRYSKVVPEGAFLINVTASKWSWTFEYPRSDGGKMKYASAQNIPSAADERMAGSKKESQAMVVPINTPIRINLFSKDVVHSFFVPNFRVKADAMPKPSIDTPNYLWFEATKLGLFDFHCTEYCGVGHSQMSGFVKVVSKDDFKIWLKNKSEESILIQKNNPGFVIWETNGCASCHSNDGDNTNKLGPSFKGLLKRKRNVRNPDGSETKDIVADFEYVKESILFPKRKVVSGFQNVMTAQDLTDEEIKQVFEYLKTIQD
ncbi:MAG: cytochrome c oxidase subunit II [Planctomycetota bacterium]|nr:MAG: cytochrome c oxidase subunit II [Planctomycetota bacterium]